MKKLSLKILFLTILLISSAKANIENYQRPNFIQQKQVDAMLEKRLNLTQEQKNYIKQNRPVHKKEMEAIVHQMQELHDKIRNIYYSGIPKFQADLKTAPMKAELVMLRQSAAKMKQENRKNFENTLSDEQKIEFEKIKKEYAPHHKK